MRLNAVITGSNSKRGVVQCFLSVYIVVETNNIEKLHVDAVANFIGLRVLCSDRFRLNPVALQTFFELVTSELSTEIMNDLNWTGITANPLAVKFLCCRQAVLVWLNADFEPSCRLIDDRDTVIAVVRTNKVDVHTVPRVHCIERH